MPKLSPILIIEDDQDISSTLVEMLVDEGYTVKAVFNGKEALEYLNGSSNLPGLILLDLMMPVMDANGFRAEQLKIPSLAAIPTVLLSADSNLVSRAAQLRLDRFLKKPVDLVKLFELAYEYCDKNNQN